MSDSIAEVNSIFQQPWWLDAVSPGKWREVTVERGGRIVGRMPYVIKKHLGMTLLTMPKLTQTLGPWIEPKNAKYAKVLGWQKDVMSELIAKLPPCSYFCQNFNYEVTNWLPFYWMGFKQTTRYTYVIDDLSDLEKIWKNLRENIRRESRKARKRVVVRSDLGVECFIDLNEMTFRRQGLRLPYSRDLVRRIDDACGDEHRRIFFAEDGKDNIHAAIYVVWDEGSAYYLMGGGNPELRNSGATSLLLWEAIKFASTVTVRFDFEGSMIESVERFFRSFGARQTPYFQITRVAPGMSMMLGTFSSLRMLLKI